LADDPGVTAARDFAGKPRMMPENRPPGGRRGAMPHRTYNVREAAEYLHVTEAEVEELVRAGEIPFESMGNRVVFRRKDVDSWASCRVLGLECDGLDDFHRKTSAKYHDLSKQKAIIPELMQVRFVEPALAARTRASVIREMAALASATGLVALVDDLRVSLEARERLASTALPGGVAMLHPQHHDPYLFDDSFILLARTIQSLPFGSPDGLTTDIYFLIASQDERIHLHLLARLCAICHKTDALDRLRAADGAREMFEVLLGAEEEILRGMRA
jgi:PTS system nitrogen regulatory IIA component